MAFFMSVIHLTLKRYVITPIGIKNINLDIKNDTLTKLRNEIG